MTPIERDRATCALVIKILYFGLLSKCLAFVVIFGRKLYKKLIFLDKKLIRLDYDQDRTSTHGKQGFFEVFFCRKM